MPCFTGNVTTSLDALDAAYGGLSEFISSLNEAQSWAPTRCTGWVVRDLILHLLGDAQRGLVALATHGDGDPDKDAVTYWRDAPGAPDPEFRGVRALRSMASQSSLRYLASTYAETVAAVRFQARRTPPDTVVMTQSHILRVDDLIATLTVEAVIHHLDMMYELAHRGPAPIALALVRSTLDGLLGRSTPTTWSDTDWALVASGRVAPRDEHRTALDSDIGQLPLLR